MNNVFWVGVYPGLTEEMIDYIAQSLREVAASAKHNLALVP
jgi:CDP-6-deoxy-D-xylo-4-hexulose-3-dehydrase